MEKPSTLMLEHNRKRYELCATAEKPKVIYIQPKEAIEEQTGFQVENTDTCHPDVIE